MDRADEEHRAAGADLGQGRHRGVGRRQQPPLRHHRSEGRRHLHVGRRRRDVEADQRRPPHPPARVLLHAHLRRPEGEGHVLRPQYRAVPLGRRRQDAARHPGAARRQPRSVDRARRSAAAWPTRNDGGGNVSLNGGESWTEPALSDRRSSTTSSRRTHVPYHVCGAQQDNSTACVLERRHRRRPLRRRRRRERLHRARSARHQRLLRRQLRRPADAHQPADRRGARDQRVARQPDGAHLRQHDRSASSGRSRS